MSGVTSVERKARRNHAILEAMGGEPVWDLKKDISQIGSLLNWYSQNKNSTDGQKYFVQYFKRENKPALEIKHLEKLKPWEIGTHGWLARIVALTEPRPEELVKKLDEKYATLIAGIVPEVPEVVEVKKELPNIQDRLQEQLSEYMSEVEGWIDDFFENKFESKIVPFEWFKEKQIKPLQIKNLSEHYKNHNLAELKLAQSGKDDQLVEAYEFLGKSGLKKIIGFIETIIEGADKWYDISKQLSSLGRKPRIKKTKPAIKQIAKLKYLKESGEFKSIDPIKVIGAEQLWVYNVKYRTLGVYVCSNPHGFQIKGCTILNFDEKESSAKKLRKPEEVIPKVLEAGKVALRKILPTVRAKEKKLTGRINKDTILIKVI